MASSDFVIAAAPARRRASLSSPTISAVHSVLRPPLWDSRRVPAVVSRTRRAPAAGPAKRSALEQIIANIQPRARIEQRLCECQKHATRQLRVAELAYRICIPESGVAFEKLDHCLSLLTVCRIQRIFEIYSTFMFLQAR